MRLQQGVQIAGLLLETCRDLDRSITRPRVRPVEELPADIRVEFPRSLREQHPLGTRFRADVTICQKHWATGDPKGPPYLRADTNSIVLAAEYAPENIMWAIQRPRTISGRAYDWIEIQKVTDAREVAEFSGLRRAAYSSAKLQVSEAHRDRLQRARSQLVSMYACARSRGNCEGCDSPAPFLRSDDTPYLEVHHIHALAAGGSDHPLNVAALCPNCHRRVEYGKDGFEFNVELKFKVKNAEDLLGAL